MRRMSQMSVPMPKIIAPTPSSMTRAVGAHRLGHAELERVGDQRVADRDLEHAAAPREEGGEVGAVEVVAGVDAEADALRRRRGRGEGREHLGLARRAAGLGVGLGVELDAVGADACARAIAAGLGSMNRLTRTPSVRASAISGASRSASAARSQPWSDVACCSLSGTNVHCCGRSSRTQRHQVVERIALDVELGLRPVLQQRGELAHVAGADVALVGARVHGDAVRAGLERDRRRPTTLGIAECALVAQQGDLVDVDRQRRERPPRVEAGR